jgi:hypothetical protein
MDIRSTRRECQMSNEVVKMPLSSGTPLKEHMKNIKSQLKFIMGNLFLWRF